MSELLPEGSPSPWQERLALVAPSLAGRSRRQLGLALAGLLALLAVLAVVAWWLFRAPPPPVELSLPVATSAPASVPGGGAAPVPTPTTASARLIVQAAGAVAHPGVYEVPSDARVVDLVAVAGGATTDADLDRLALAAPLVDGQRVYVPRLGEEVVAVADGGGGGSASGGSPGGAPGPAGPLDLNTATAEQLDTLPGVGPATAGAIVQHREREGPFGSVDGLLDVPGIGPAKLAALRDLVRV